jgi:hypothetical protein
MKALSIRQPWAWLIVRPDLQGVERTLAFQRGEIKTIENRGWPARYRGPLLIHAAKGMTRYEYEDVVEFLRLDPGLHAVLHTLPAFEDLQRGGIVGRADLVDCVTASESRFFFGTFGFVMANAVPLPFRPLKGALGFFEVPAP